MLVEELNDLWICSCGNWVDEEFHWCPDCCEEKFTFIYDAKFRKESRA
jgi:hypothetical protein